MTMPLFGDCVMEQLSSAPSGSGAFTISTTAQWQTVSGWPGQFQTICSIPGLVASSLLTYKAFDTASPPNVETGLGTWTSGSLARTTIYSSTNGNAAVTTFSGTVTVMATPVAVMTGVVRGQIAGCTLSNDGTSPTTVLDIAAGQCADSTSAVYINVAGTYYKSTGGSWSAGAGSSGSPKNGMGSGLSIAANTWYHVFAILNGGSPDVYFDTSATAVNAPSGTTYSRRIGSFKTNASLQIIAFVQDEETFYWATAAIDINDAALSTTPTLYTFTVPTGVKVRPLLSMHTFSNAYYIIASPDGDDTGTPAANTAPGATIYSGITAEVAPTKYTNTSGQLYVWCSAADNASVTTYGWIDSRERFA